MTWRSFLGCASSLVSLHDSDVMPGETRKSAREREKPTKTNAYWLDLGVCLLTFLQEKEERDNETMVPLESILDHFRAVGHADVTLEDVRYVAHRLSQSTTIMFLSPSGAVDPVETALLLRPHDSLAAVRLSPAGREALGYSISLADTEFADLDAQKMRRLIEDGQYVRAREACSALLSCLRSTGHAITEADERLGANDLRDHFIRSGTSYAASIAKTQGIVHEILAFVELQLDEKLKNESYLALLGLQEDMRTLLTACQRLDRHLARLLRRLNERPAASTRMFRFDHLLAHWLVSAVPNDEVVAAMADVTAPSQLEIVPLDVALLQGVVPVPPAPAAPETVVLRPLTPPPDGVSEARLAALVDAYAQHVSENVNGAPLSLFALLAGNLPLPPLDPSEIAVLYGTTLAPPSGSSLAAFEVSRGPSVTSVANSVGLTIRGHDIMIARSDSHGPG